MNVCLTVETKVRGTWKLHHRVWRFVSDMDEVLGEACKVLAGIIVDDFIGSEARVQWRDGEIITLTSNDAALDDYLVVAREQQRRYVEAQRRRFREVES